MNGGEHQDLGQQDQGWRKECPQRLHKLLGLFQERRQQQVSGMGLSGCAAVESQEHFRLDLPKRHIENPRVLSIYTQEYKIDTRRRYQQTRDQKEWEFKQVFHDGEPENEDYKQPPPGLTHSSSSLLDCLLA
ncbi:hypothetical protein KSP39_PZI004726 [Platanthera zijinensis]|uniref:Uncharacterized protein n=1 Tax=Platanthera zijinensis TaxID=2320716 RepID=A0AAP0BZ79_9ASPA